MLPHVIPKVERLKVFFLDLFWNLTKSLYEHITQDLVFHCDLKILTQINPYVRNQLANVFQLEGCLKLEDPLFCFICSIDYVLFSPALVYIVIPVTKKKKTAMHLSFSIQPWKFVELKNVAAVILECVSLVYFDLDSTSFVHCSACQAYMKKTENYYHL